MAEKNQQDAVDLSESSVYGDENADEQNAAGDTATEELIDRLEQITGGPEDAVLPVTGKLGREFDALDASTDEEIDALEQDLYQAGELRSSRDGTGLVVDEVAEEQLAELTEVGPDLAEEGALSVTPGRDDPSAILRSHHPNTQIARADAVVEGNLDEPRDEEVGERKVDEGTAG